MIIGSQAALYYFPDFYRSVNDIDRIFSQKTKGEDNKISPALEFILKKYNGYEYAPPIVLYTLKLSHCFWNIHWQKTMADIKFFQDKGISHDEELFDLLYQDWINIHGPKRAYLKKPNNKFFEDNVNRKYVHDDLHNAIAYYDCPMYEQLKNDLNQALVLKELFNELSFEDQLKLCREEIYVTALERILIPKNFHISKRYAYNQAIKLLLTSMSKGWFPKFIALNYNKLYKPDEHPFVNLFQKALKENKIKTL